LVNSAPSQKITLYNCLKFREFYGYKKVDNQFVFSSALFVVVKSGIWDKHPGSTTFEFFIRHKKKNAAKMLKTQENDTKGLK
jgi:hypothetical protein